VTPLRVGVIGLGVGEQHLAGFRADPRCDVVAVCDLDDARLATFGAGMRTTTDAIELIDDPDIDIVSVASYDDDHYAQALRAIRNGKSVFVEKPLCRTQEELRELRHALDKHPEVVLASNLVLRGAPVFRFLREQIRSGAFGTPYAFDGDYLYGRLHKITDGWRAGVEDYSVLLGGGIHLVDLMLWLTGERPLRVAATGNRISTEGTSFKYPDFVSATYEFASGLIGRITANFGAVIPHRHVLRVFGTEATFVSDDAGVRIYRSRDPQTEPEHLDLAAVPASKAELIPDFVGRVIEGAADTHDVRHELDVISACVAGDRARATGGSVDIEYD